MDYQKRIQHLQGIIKKEKADWFIITNLYNVRYLSGFSGSHAVLLIGPKKQYFITDGRYQEQVRTEVKDYETVIEGKRKGLDVIQDVLGDLSKKTVWFEADHCTVAFAEELQKKLTPKKMTGKGGIVELMRQVKDDDEIKIMRKALRIAETALKNTVPQIREGMTERELAHTLEYEMWKEGAEKESFDSLILFGARSSLPHGKPGNKKLKKGQTVLMDFGCKVEGYCSDITRTFFFGKPPEEMKKIYELVLIANKTAIANIDAGTKCYDADQFAREVIDEGGYGVQFMHGLGHSVGLEIHENPRLSFRSDEVLQAGNLVTIEPGIYLENKGGVRIEDMVVVKDGECMVLNKFPKEMMVL